VYIQAGGKLEQSAFIARFNKTYGDEVRGAYVSNRSIRLAASRGLPARVAARRRSLNSSL
jgi:hypothetical protein